MGPAVPIMDLRIKLIIPPDEGLLDLPAEGWWDFWQAMPEHARGHLRTYSIRSLRRYDDAPDELDVDFVLHSHNAGPASAWAESALPGQKLWIIGPSRDDASGVGIEFAPGAAAAARLYGDETALPAISRILEDWPEGLAGSADIEVPAGNALHIEAPAHVDVRLHFRSEPETGHGDMLYARLRQNIEPLFASDTPIADESGNAHNDGDNQQENLWETPTYSGSGEPINGATVTSGHTYYWIAGKNTAVTAMRRLLVKKAGVPRQHVSFMGYWR